MHYYQFNIGDYHSHTNHLELLEDLAYRRMLDWCYLNELPLPEDLSEIGRLIRMRTHSECIEIVLRDFFTLTDDGYTQARIVNEVSAYREKSAKAKKSALARWNKPPSKDGDNGDANALRTESEGNAKHKPLTTNHKPVNNKDTSSSIDDCPHQKIIDLYHSQLPQLRRVKVWNDKRKKSLRTRWRENPKHQSLEFWSGLFDYVAGSDFLIGNKNDFQADLEWIINPSNFVKIVEGKYHE